MLVVSFLGIKISSLLIILHFIIGGLLKYVTLLVNGFFCDKDIDVQKLEKYMSTRFLMDHPNHEITRFGHPLQVYIYIYIHIHIYIYIYIYINIYQNKKVYKHPLHV